MSLCTQMKTTTQLPHTKSPHHSAAERKQSRGVERLTTEYGRHFLSCFRAFHGHVRIGAFGKLKPATIWYYFCCCHCSDCIILIKLQKGIKRKMQIADRISKAKDTRNLAKNSTTSSICMSATWCHANSHLHTCLQSPSSVRCAGIQLRFANAFLHSLMPLRFGFNSVAILHLHLATYTPRSL